MYRQVVTGSFVTDDWKVALQKQHKQTLFNKSPTLAIKLSLCAESEAGDLLVRAV